MTLLRKLDRRLRKAYLEFDERIRWRKWLRSEFDERSTGRLRAPALIGALKEKPVISILVPVYNIEEKFLRKCIESVLAQWYPHFELCIADDKSSQPHVRKVLAEFAEKDQRIRLVFRDVNGGISEASNSALDLATGEFCALLDHDDELAEDALFRVAAELNRDPKADVFYSDEDKIDQGGRRFDPTFKPGWGRDLFYSLNLFNHLTVYRTTVIRTAGAFRKGFEGSQDYDLALRVVEQIPDKNIRHIPRILYHWRALPGSVALAGSEKSYAHERARTALADHLERTGVAATVEPTVNNWHRVRYSLGGSNANASVFVFGSNTSAVTGSVERLRRSTAGKSVEFNEVVGAPTDLAAALNDAVARSESAVLCFMTAGLTPLTGAWLDEMRSLALQPAIGAVGAKILNSNETVAGSGLILGVVNIAVPAHYGLPRAHGGNLGRNTVICNYSAVSAMCIATDRRHFKAAKGFDAVSFPSALFDADYCLRLRKLGLRVVFTPFAELISSENVVMHNFPSLQETEAFLRKWPDLLENDPFYNPNFSAADGRFRIKI